QSRGKARAEDARKQMTPERYQQIRSLFLAALELPANERPGFLQKSCQDDLSLRREVESLIVAHEGAESFLEVSPTPLVADQLLEETQLQNGDSIVLLVRAPVPGTFI